MLTIPKRSVNFQIENEADCNYELDVVETELAIQRMQSELGEQEGGILSNLLPKFCEYLCQKLNCTEFPQSVAFVVLSNVREEFSKLKKKLADDLKSQGTSET